MKDKTLFAIFAAGLAGAVFTVGGIYIAGYILGAHEAVNSEEVVERIFADKKTTE